MCLFEKRYGSARQYRPFGLRTSLSPVISPVKPRVRRHMLPFPSRESCVPHLDPTCAVELIIFIFKSRSTRVLRSGKNQTLHATNNILHVSASLQTRVSGDWWVCRPACWEASQPASSGLLERRTDLHMHNSGRHVASALAVTCFSSALVGRCSAPVSEPHCVRERETDFERLVGQNLWMFEFLVKQVGEFASSRSRHL